jgi:hypothetical protein
MPAHLSDSFNFMDEMKDTFLQVISAFDASHAKGDGSISPSGTPPLKTTQSRLKLEAIFLSKEDSLNQKMPRRSKLETDAIDNHSISDPLCQLCLPIKI